MFLSPLVTAVEGYQGILVSHTVFERFCFFRKQVASAGVPFDCGAVSIVRRPGTLLAQVPAIDSAKL